MKFRTPTGERPTTFNDVVSAKSNVSIAQKEARRFSAEICATHRMLTTDELRVRTVTVATNHDSCTLVQSRREPTNLRFNSSSAHRLVIGSVTAGPSADSGRWGFVERGPLYLVNQQVRPRDAADDAYGERGRKNKRCLRELGAV